MPDGKTHYKMYKMGFALAFPASVISGIAVNPAFGLGYISGFFSSRWWDCDQDIMGTSNAEGRMVNELPFIGHLLYGISSVYGSIFREHHRSIWTHGPFISTAIRMIFFFFWLPMLHLFFQIKPPEWELWFALSFYLGICQNDIVHWLADLATSEKRHTKRPLTKLPHYSILAPKGHKNEKSTVKTHTRAKPKTKPPYPPINRGGGFY